jgi:hypothetical protein
MNDTMKGILGENWITKLGGLIAAIGGVLALLPKSLDLDPQWGAFAVGLGGAIAGFGAKDYNVHSTQAEVKTSTEVKKEQTKEEIAALEAELKAKK